MTRYPPKRTALRYLDLVLAAPPDQAQDLERQVERHMRDGLSRGAAERRVTAEWADSGATPRSGLL